jgi:hypothetical protein
VAFYGRCTSFLQSWWLRESCGPMSPIDFRSGVAMSPRASRGEAASRAPSSPRQRVPGPWWRRLPGTRRPRLLTREPIHPTHSRALPSEIVPISSRERMRRTPGTTTGPPQSLAHSSQLRPMPG